MKHILTTTLILVLVLFGFLSLLETTVLQNLLGSSIAFLAAGIMIYSLGKIVRVKTEVKLIITGIIMYGVVHLTFTLHDVFYYDLDNLIRAFYIIPSLFFMVSSLMYFKRNIKEWHFYQLFLDVFYIGAVFIIVFYRMYAKGMFVFEASLLEMVIYYAYLVANLLVLNAIVLLISSTRKQNMNKMLKGYVIALLLYVLVEVYLGYSLVTGQFMPDSLVRMIHLICFIVFALSTLYFNEEQRQARDFDRYDYKNIGHSRVT